LFATYTVKGKNVSQKVNIKDWQAFQDKFSSEEDCIAFLFKIKWPDGFRCPQCNRNEAYTLTSRRLPLYQCCSCRHQTSLTVGTIMEGSRTSLHKWLTAIFFASRTDYSINAVQLRELIKVTYKTAWSMFSLIRYSISLADTKQSLHGQVKGDLGIFSALPFSATLNLKTQEKPVFVGGSMDEKGQPNHIKMKIIPLEHIEGSRLLPSGIRTFAELYTKVNIENVNFIPRFSNKRNRTLKKMFDQVAHRLNCTFRGLRALHLQSYLDEACCRINLILQDRNVFDYFSQCCMVMPRFNKPQLCNEINYTEFNAVRKTKITQNIPAFDWKAS
jgi:transposase-like protein